MSRALAILKNSNLLKQLKNGQIIINSINRKLNFQRIQPCLDFHSTPHAWVASKKHSKKKIVSINKGECLNLLIIVFIARSKVKPVVFKPKKTVIEIKHDMTIQNIADACGRTLGN